MGTLAAWQGRRAESAEEQVARLRARVKELEDALRSAGHDWKCELNYDAQGPCNCRLSVLK